MPAALAVSQELRSPPGSNTLSREHSAEIDVPELDLAASFRRVTDRCTADSAHHCVILQSNLSSVQYASGLVKLRIDPAGVEDLVSFASRLGKLQRRSTKVEDLADAIADTHSRIEMLTTYRKHSRPSKQTSNVHPVKRHFRSSARLRTWSPLISWSPPIELSGGRYVEPPTISYRTWRMGYRRRLRRWPTSCRGCSWSFPVYTCCDFFGGAGAGGNDALTTA